MPQQQQQQHRLRPMGDQVCLTNRPCPVDAIKWSEDNLIAVAAAHSVVITSPADMCGPRGHGAVDPNAQVRST
jgi:hypothetical protein